MAKALTSVAVGSTILLDGKELMVLHHGNPDASVYDASCDGTWVCLKNLYALCAFGEDTDYETSNLRSVETEFWQSISAAGRSVIKSVKIPYHKGAGGSSVVKTLGNGLPCNIFALSAVEIGMSGTGAAAGGDGGKLDYFDEINSKSEKRVALYNGEAKFWWTRAYYNVDSYKTSRQLTVTSQGAYSGTTVKDTTGVGCRPAFIIRSDIYVDDSNNVITNESPTVTASTGSLGIQNEPFAWRYMVSDPEDDPITVREYLDGSLVSTHSGLDSGTTMTFGYTNNPDNFRKILNGSHTLTVIPADSYGSGTALTASWTKAVHAATITLAEPLSVTGDIEVAILSVSGSIPADASYKVEVTNNAKDSTPVWQDCTAEVKAGENIVFENKTSARGAAFNFRISVSRGASGVGGYIDAVRGAFQ